MPCQSGLLVELPSQTLVRYAVIGASDLESLWEGGSVQSTATLPPEFLAMDLPSATAELERLMVQQAMAGSGGNRAEAARRLGIHRQLLYRKLKQFNLG